VDGHGAQGSESLSGPCSAPGASRTASDRRPAAARLAPACAGSLGRSATSGLRACSIAPSQTRGPVPPDLTPTQLWRAGEEHPRSRALHGAACCGPSASRVRFALRPLTPTSRGVRLSAIRGHRNARLAHHPRLTTQHTLERRARYPHLHAALVARHEPTVHASAPLSSSARACGAGGSDRPPFARVRRLRVKSGASVSERRAQRLLTLSALVLGRSRRRMALALTLFVRKRTVAHRARFAQPMRCFLRL